MERRKIAGTDIEASVVGLGCNNFGMKLDEAGSHAVIDATFEHGINFFDTADMYGETNSETFIGSGLKGRRDQCVLATKFGGLAMGQDGGWTTREAIEGTLEDSLRRLQTDWIDLYQIHYPDPQTPIDEALAALDSLVQSGKVRAIGHSNFTTAMIDAGAEAAAKSGQRAFSTAQNEWNLLNREVERDIVPSCESHGVQMLPYFPLASGMLTGKYKRGEAFASGSRLDVMPDYFAHVASDGNFDKIEALEKFAADSDRTLLEVAIGWLASQPCVLSVIVGATTPEQVETNAAAGACRLTSSELVQVDAILD